MAAILVPVTTFLHGFTTSPVLASSNCDDLNPPPPLSHVELGDEERLGVHKTSGRTRHELVKDLPEPVSSSSGDPPERHLPPPSEAWQASYPKGSINPSASIPGGFGFYLSGPQRFKHSIEDEAATEVVMSYRVMFQADWEWRKGGKLPGICQFTLFIVRPVELITYLRL